MAGSIKDALQKAGVSPKEETPPPPRTSPTREWREELPAHDESAPHIPFEAPAILKLKGKPKSKKP